MRISSTKHADDLYETARDRELHPTVGMLMRIKRMFVFLSPLSVFMPELNKNTNPLKVFRKDWNLTLLAVAYGFTVSIMVGRVRTAGLPVNLRRCTQGSYTYKFQYAASTFGWSSETVSHSS